jgi:hypothetical protein
MVKQRRRAARFMNMGTKGRNGKRRRLDFSDVDQRARY